MKAISKKVFEIVYTQYIPMEMEEGKLYISEKYHTCNHLCPCGCKNQIPIPLTENKGYGWQIFHKNGDKNLVTLSPSLLNRFCPNKTHYVVNDSVFTLLP